MIDQISNETQVFKTRDSRPWFKKKRFLIPASFLTLAIIGRHLENSKSPTNTTSNKHEEYSVDGKERKHDTIVQSASTSDNNASKIKEQLKRELVSIEKPIDIKSYTGSIAAVQMGLVLFAAYVKIIQDGENSTDPETKKLAIQFKKKVISQQAKAFPQLRKNYADVAAQKLWESNIYVTITGANNSIINLTGAIFSTNKNIAETQKVLQDILTQFRFKEVRYRWYKGADEFTYYKLDTQNDTDLLAFN